MFIQRLTMQLTNQSCFDTTLIKMNLNKNCSFFLVFLLLICNENVAPTENEPNSIVVTTGSGKIRGYSAKTMFSQWSYYAFKGIPYAETPIGERRFKLCFINSKLITNFAAFMHLLLLYIHVFMLILTGSDRSFTLEWHTGCQ